MSVLIQEQVIDLVEKVLRKTVQPPYSVSLIRESIRQENDWWYIPVQLSPPMSRTYQYYDILSDVEVQLQEEHDVNVLLVPTRSDDEEERKEVIDMVAPIIDENQPDGFRLVIGDATFDRGFNGWTVWIRTEPSRYQGTELLREIVARIDQLVRSRFANEKMRVRCSLYREE